MIDIIKNITGNDVEKSLKRNNRTLEDLLVLLSPAADHYLEEIAQIARSLTFHHHGKLINLFAPLYISDYCENECIYCGFRSGNKLQRRKLNEEEISQNYHEIKQSGIENILLLTGEAHKVSPPEYIAKAVQSATNYFSSISIEVYPMEIEDYKLMADNGCDGMTVYQETYDQEIYKKVHLKGRKADYNYRYTAPERAILGGMRQITLGALYGLGDPYFEAYHTAQHIMELKKKYPHVEYAVSFPRIRDASNILWDPILLQDTQFVRMMLAFRLVFPEIGMVLSTRESKQLRDGLTGLCITKLSAGSKTDVGGYTMKEDTTGQFSIRDERSVDAVISMIKAKHLEPVFKNWINPTTGVQHA